MSRLAAVTGSVKTTQKCSVPWPRLAASHSWSGNAKTISVAVHAAAARGCALSCGVPQNASVYASTRDYSYELLSIATRPGCARKSAAGQGIGSMDLCIRVCCTSVFRPKARLLRLLFMLDTHVDPLARTLIPWRQLPSSIERLCTFRED